MTDETVIADVSAESAPSIHTPDWRLRVFVSSTMGELAAEREAAKTAIRTLRLSPVMFELGARPHPPRDLYRSYLAQSEIFVGIYWQSYGWVAPDMEISGIEDEYLLSRDRPRLIYVKEPASARDPRLERLLDHVRADGQVSYKRFESPGELAELLLDDLAVLMSERFDASHASRALPSGTLTFLFSDIEGSTELLERLDGDYADVLHRYHGLVRAAVTGRGGMIVDTEGDGIFCVFREAANATEAAVEIQRSLAAGPLGPDASVRARIGLHTGRATATAEGYVGLDVHRAARIGAAGHGGQIVASAAVAGLLTDVVSRQQWHLRDLGSYALKGLSRTERLFQLDAPGVEEEFPPLRARRPAQVRLPAPLTALVGRGREIGQLASLFSRGESRLVTLTGPGGIGKTRLALAVAEQIAADYPDGVYFASLALLTEADHVLPRIAELTEIPVSGSALEALADAFSHQRVLLVIDNFEQVVPAASDMVELLARSPGLHVLVTSRVALRVGGEHEYRVEPLDVPPDAGAELSVISNSAAVRLFAERARAVRPSFQVTEENASDIATICCRLDGLPLAIELAAARLRMLTPKALLDQLNRSLDVLGKGTADLPERQRTLRSTIDWSHDLLTDDEQRVFRQLSVFAGPWTLDATVAVDADDPGEVVTIVESLVEKSLLLADTGPDGEPRFRMLVTIRDYGAGRLTESGEAPAVRDRHADHYLAVAEHLGAGLTGSGQGAALAALDLEWDNISEAADWLLEREQHEKVIRLGYALTHYLWLRGHVSDTLQWIERVRRSGTVLPPELNGRMLFLAGGGTFEKGDYTRAIGLLDQSIDALAEVDDPECLAWAHYIRAATLPAFGVDNETVGRDLGDALALFEANGDEWGQMWAHTNLGMLASTGGDIPHALEHHRLCLTLASRLENEAMLAQAHTQLAFTFLTAGQLDQAKESLATAVEIHKTISYREGLSYCLDALAGLAMYEGDTARAMVAIGAAEATRDRLGIRPWPAVKWFLDFLSDTANAVDDDDLKAARVAGRQMDPVAAAVLALG